MYPEDTLSVKLFSIVSLSLAIAVMLFVVTCGYGKEKQLIKTNKVEVSDKKKESSKSITPKLEQSKGSLSGLIEIDGSSTVFPITQAVAEEFNKIHPNVHILVGISGTGGGMKRFTKGETSISDASRPIKDRESATAAENNIEFIEVTVAYDGLSVIVNPANSWVECLTIEDLNKIWRPDDHVNKWSDLNPSWPDKTINLYGPGTDSGTFDYFTSEVNGDEGVSRADYVASEDDNLLVIGIAGDKNSLGYFGYAYYAENKDKSKIVAIDGGTGCTVPSMDTIANGAYTPLSRPLFIYLNKDHLETRAEIGAFVNFYLNEGRALVAEVGYVPLPDAEYDKQLHKVR